MDNNGRPTVIHASELAGALLIKGETMIALGAQIVVVINGKGGVGKDTICNIASNLFRTKNISAITPIKDIALRCGWNGEKDNKSRKFLSDLKRLLIEYNDLPNRYLLEEYNDFRQDDSRDILFVHIREPDQIRDFVKRVDGRCITLLVRSHRTDICDGAYGNPSDDNVEDYEYDYVFYNDCDEQELSEKVERFFCSLFLD